MNEGFKQHAEKEKEVLQRVVAAEETKQALKKKDLEIADLEVLRKRNELTQELLERYPDLLFLQRYGDYLEGEVKRMSSGAKIKGLKIVNDAETRSVQGNQAESDFLHDVNLKRDSRILSLRNRISEDEKRMVFEELIKYYSDSEFQKEEECRLATISKNLFMKTVETEFPQTEVEEVKFLTGVGTTLDFNFGVDGWVEIREKTGKITKIYFDMKMGTEGKKSSYADLLLNLEQENGRVDMKNITNAKSIRDFIYKLVAIYKDKNREAIVETKAA